MSACDRFLSDRMVNIASIVCIIISIICAAIVGYRSTQMRTIDHGHEPLATNKSFEWCLPCKVLANRSNANLLEKMDKTLKGGVQNCCAHNSEQATSLLELMASTDQPGVQGRLDPGSFALSKVSAHQHLTLTTFRSMDDPVFWEDDNVSLEFDETQKHPLIDHARNITVMQYAVVVEIPGHYYVYSGIFYQPINSKSCKDFTKQIWDHNIVLTRSDDSSSSGIIFNSTYTCCDECQQPSKTSYAGGFFHLQKNDRLHVEVSSDGVVSFRKEGSYFGLFLLD